MRRIATPVSVITGSSENMKMPGKFAGTGILFYGMMLA
jgi:hypothetical protein